MRFQQLLRSSIVLLSLTLLAATRASAQAPTGACSFDWQPLFGGASGVDGTVRALVVFDDGSGPALYAGGDFTNAGGSPASHIAKWNGSNWSALGAGVSGGTVQALQVYNDGGGPALFVGGSFTSAGGAPANYVAKWNGTNWSPLGAGSAGIVRTFAVFNDGTGSALFVGCNTLQKWNGSGWTYINNQGGTLMIDYVLDLVVHDDGAGSALYIGGGAMIPYLWRWDGVQWTAVLVPFGDIVSCLGTYDDGSGMALYESSYMPSFLHEGIVRWTPAGWTHLGAGLSGTNPLDEYGVAAMQVFNDGGGTSLFVGGLFTMAGGAPAGNIAKWDGTTWSTLGSGLNDFAAALAVFDDGTGPGLFVGGTFVTAGGAPANHIAKWGRAPGCFPCGFNVCEPGMASVIACPCANPPALVGQGCNNSSATGGARLSATGSPHLSHDVVVFNTVGEKPTATSVVLQGSSTTILGAAFGQGVRCLSGSLKRLYTKTAASGSITAPSAGDPTITSRSSALGDSIAPGTHRYYGVYYRDPIVLGGCPAASTFNITQQLDILWVP